MKNVIAGTAGHIDHGKTALVRALTGTDTDRLKEEKERGISIDLGFAHLDLPDNVRLGFVDVPGHERFIKNMLAGAGGIDLVLFVIAADESIKPQSREHFDICRLLNIPKGIVVLTKSDLVDPEILDLVRLEVEEFVRGSFLEGAPMVPVSSTTGQGLPELRAELQRIAVSAAEKDASRYFRLPVDRAFSMRGFGTVVTGTLISGGVRAEEEIEVHPGPRRVRVRGIQVHGETVPRAVAGQRTALNLAGAEASELQRGMMLSEAGRFMPTRVIDCTFDLLPGAKSLKHRAPVHFHAHTAEIEAEIRGIGTTEVLRPGTRRYVRLLLREPSLLLPGDRFIVRMFSPVITIGGGVVLDIAPPKRGGVDRLKTLEQGSIRDRIALLVAESASGMSIPDIISRTGLLESEIAQAVKDAAFTTITEPQHWIMDSRWVTATLKAIEQTLAKFHREKPLIPGMSKEQLRSLQLPNAQPFVFDALLARSKTIALQGENVRLASHRVSLKEDEQQATAKIEQAFASAGLAVPPVNEVLTKSGVEGARARSLLQILIREKKLVKVSEELVFHSSALQQLRELLSRHKGQRFAVPEFKEWTGISRKYAIPLLEFLDRERITRREGDSRLVL
ncbi:MAG TPA: selenocysteine-specific translation elongation factor [Bryobacteraceae bacterium]|nr:selenocysteine-specific translation elongation factor [Bryobacteraceae bacterium]